MSRQEDTKRVYLEDRQAALAGGLVDDIEHLEAQVQCGELSYGMAIDQFMDLVEKKPVSVRQQVIDSIVGFCQQMGLPERVADRLLAK